MWKKLFSGRQTRRQGGNCSQSFVSQQSHQSSEHEEDGFVVVGETAIERSTVRPDHVNTNYPLYPDAPPSYASQVVSERAPAYDLLHFSPLTMGQRSSNQVTTESSPEYVANGSVNGPVTLAVEARSAQSSRPDLPMYGPGCHPGGQSLTPRTPRPHNDTTSVVSTLPGEILSEQELRDSLQTPGPDPYSSPLNGVPFKLAPWLELPDWDWAALDCVAMPNVNLAQYEYDFSVERSTIREYTNATR